MTSAPPPARLAQKSSLPMSFPFAKPASMTSPNGGHRRMGGFTTDLRVLVIATTIFTTAGVVLLQLIGRSIISFANKSCQSRFAPNNERLALQIDERRRDKRQGARSLMSKQQPLRRNYG
jgi:hypothetical protein